MQISIVVFYLTLCLLMLHSSYALYLISVDILPGRADKLNTVQVNLRKINIQEIKALKHLLTADLSTLSRLGLFK